MKSASRQPVPVLRYFPGDRFFPAVQCEPPKLQVVAIASC